MLKVQLVVTAAGPNQGRAIPLSVPKFLIGRDPDCQLRPASQAISKRHCSVTVREGKVFVQDIGSTNGTVVRGETIQGEVEVVHGDALKIGPLEFRIEITGKKLSDGTPIPESMKDLSAASAAKLKAVMAPKLGSSGTNPSVKPAPVPDVEAEAMAAMMMALDTEEPAGVAPAGVPDGNTIMEMPGVEGAAGDGSSAGKKKKGTISGAEMSSAANDILRKYIRRTGG